MPPGLGVIYTGGGQTDGMVALFVDGGIFSLSPIRKKSLSKRWRGSASVVVCLDPVFREEQVAGPGVVPEVCAGRRRAVVANASLCRRVQGRCSGLWTRRALIQALEIWLFAATAASGQTNPGVYDRADAVQAICRQYAAAQRVLPYDTMYAQCMYARRYRVPGFSPSLNAPGYQGELPGPATHDGGA
jgi:hypothetical protein